ncbi:hypothetical protein [Pedobacter mucosus]|uniref:hypothetical protein n=1 Tax=Pedobacter mucosus TaxID=2895286 RepID=UPI001EE43619|nr:hypothetical protein [Pedobacter mucosus]UKT63605.1 hypothetical protein LOK61_17780 [Pedobacter mucosus]
MITVKPLLSENVKDFMDYALDVIKSMDGAPEHNLEEQTLVNKRIVVLKEYLDAVAASYQATIPKVLNNSDTEGINFSGTGHS